MARRIARVIRVTCPARSTVHNPTNAICAAVATQRRLHAAEQRLQRDPVVTLRAQDEQGLFGVRLHVRSIG